MKKDIFSYSQILDALYRAGVTYETALVVVSELDKLKENK